MRVVIIDDYSRSVRSLRASKLLDGDDVTVLHEPITTPAGWQQCLAQAEALVLIRERSVIDASVLDHAPHLRIVSCAGALAGTLDLNACNARGIAVAQSRGAGHATAELCWAMILASERRLPQQIESLRKGHWQGEIGRQLHGRRLGLWGFGKIAQKVAQYGRAFGMQVWIWGRESSLDRARAGGWECAPDRAAFLAQSDIVSVQLKLNAETRHGITASDLILMKSDSLFVNTSRAGLVAPGALEAALDAGRPGAAAIDVFEDEPVTDPSHSLIGRPNVLATPHIGFVEQDNYESFFAGAFENIRRFEAGETAHLVNHASL